MLQNSGEEAIIDLLEGADMVFVTAGLGGGRMIPRSARLAGGS